MIKFNLILDDGNCIIPRREDSTDYVLNMIRDCMVSGGSIKAVFPDGSIVEVNPKED